MGRVILAIRAFFQILFDGEIAKRVSLAIDGTTPDDQVATEIPTKAPTKAAAAPAKPTPPPSRSDALTLLAALQREARFVDFIQEPIDGYSDAQVGAAVREVHRECASVLSRMFALEPVVADHEGSEIEVPANANAGRFRLTGNVSDQASYTGKLVHQGWQAAHCELPSWTGEADSRLVIAPAEVEIR